MLAQAGVIFFGTHMQNQLRPILKEILWTLLGLFSMTLAGWLFTGFLQPAETCLFALAWLAVRLIFYSKVSGTRFPGATRMDDPSAGSFE